MSKLNAEAVVESYLLSKFIKGYIEFTRTTAVYPEAMTGSQRAIRYVLNGLIGEGGEISNKIKKIDRDNLTIDQVKDSLVDEIGDLLYYLFRVIDESLSEADQETTLDETIDNYINDEHVIIEKDIDYISILMNQRISMSFSLLDDGIVAINIPLLRHVYVYVRLILDRLGIPLQEVLKRNKDKLESRKSRGKLSGSGDNR